MSAFGGHVVVVVVYSSFSPSSLVVCGEPRKKVIAGSDDQPPFP